MRTEWSTPLTNAEREALRLQAIRARANDDALDALQASMTPDVVLGLIQAIEALQRALAQAVARLEEISAQK